MHIAVTIVGFRNCEDIVRCLGALEHSSHTDFEVIICENGGKLAFERLLEALRPSVWVVSSYPSSRPRIIPDMPPV